MIVGFWIRPMVLLMILQLHAEEPIKPWLKILTLNETFLEVKTMPLSLPKVIAANPMRLFNSLSWLASF